MAVIDMRKNYDPATIRIYDRKKKEVYEEISLLALLRSGGRIAAIGNEVKSLIHNSNSETVIISPLKNGTVADFDLAVKLLCYMLRKIYPFKLFFKPWAAVSISPELTQVERKALEDAVYVSGAGKVLLSEQTEEELELTLSPRYRVIISIIADDDSDHMKPVRHELWSEICKGQIPADCYRMISLNRRESDQIITLLGQEHRVEIQFHGVLAVRMMVKEMIAEELYDETQIKKYREGGFRNVLYRVSGGQLSSTLSDRGKAYRADSGHYLLITEAEVIEMIALKEPSVSVVMTESCTESIIS